MTLDLAALAFTHLPAATPKLAAFAQHLTGGPQAPGRGWLLASGDVLCAVEAGDPYSLLQRTAAGWRVAYYVPRPLMREHEASAVYVPDPAQERDAARRRERQRAEQLRAEEQRRRDAELLAQRQREWTRAARIETLLHRARYAGGEDARQAAAELERLGIPRPRGVGLLAS